MSYSSNEFCFLRKAVIVFFSFTVLVMFCFHFQFDLMMTFLAPFLSFIS